MDPTFESSPPMVPAVDAVPAVDVDVVEWLVMRPLLSIAGFIVVFGWHSDRRYKRVVA
jgi:hypothetical protein